MDNNKISEDLYTDVDFEDDESKESKKTPENIDIEDEIEELLSDVGNKVTEFYSEDKSVLEKKIVEKKSGETVEITYTLFGKKQTVTKKDKNNKIRKFVEYHINGVLKEMTEYGLDGSYKMLTYNIDGSWLTNITKHSDGTSDAIYYDADKNGTNLIVKMDKNKKVIEKRFEK